MKVLCSPVSAEEARLLVELGVDIIDIKDASHGSLAAQPPWVIRDIVALVQERGKLVSAALGDLQFQPGTAALAAFAMAQFGVRFIKAGLHGTQTRDEAIELLTAIRRAIDMVDHSIELVAAGYADYREFGGLDPISLVQAAASTRCAIVMIDTANKRCGNLFDWMGEDEIRQFVANAREAQLKTALAGSIAIDHLSAVRRLQPDIIGVRGGLCRNGDRSQAIDPIRVQTFLSVSF